MDELRPKCEQAVGRPLLLRYDTSKNLGKSIIGDAGGSDDAFDVVILNPEIMEILTKAGKIAPGSPTDIARATFGIGVRSGAPKPDVRTAASLKAALLRTRSVTFPNEGASAPFIRAMFDKLGIAAEIKPRLMPEPTTAPALANAAEGRAELVITLTSEILPAKGIDFAGPVPDEFQGDLIFSAAIGAKAANAQAARSLINFLRTPAVGPTLKANGMEARK
jgi:molybdate transport system substrate-binding protein